MDKKVNKERFNELASNFDNAESRRKLIQEFGDCPDALWGTNENGETVMLSVCKTGLTVRVFQKNRWVRINEFDAEGQMTVEAYEGRWAELPQAARPQPAERLKLSDEQVARNDEIHNAAFELCKVLAENEKLERDMIIFAQIADFAADLLVAHGIRVRYPDVITESDGSQHIVEYHGEEK